MSKRRRGIYAIAKALHTRHGVDPDIAILAAWYHHYPNYPPPSLNYALSRFHLVKLPPVLEPHEVADMMAAYAKKRNPALK